MVLDPLQLVRNHHAAAVLQILEPPRVRGALGVGDKLVLAVVGHCEEVVLQRGLVGPVEVLYVCPALARRGVNEVLPDVVGRHGGAAPDEFGLFRGPRRGVLCGEDLAPHFGVGADFGLGPAVVAKVGHEPDVGFGGAAGERPGGGWVDLVVDDEGEFDVWEGLGGGEDCAVDGVEGGHGAGIDGAVDGDYVELGKR